MEVAGPLGTPLGLAQRKRASHRGEAGASGFLGALYPDNTTGLQKEDDHLEPGAEYTYTWFVEENQGPGPNDSNCVTRMYHSHVCLQSRRPRFDPWVGKILWRRKWQPTPVFLPGESQGRGTRRGTATPVHRPQRPAGSTHSSTRGLRPP